MTAIRVSLVQREVQIRPFRIEAFDQLQLPAAFPFLELLLPGDGLVDVAIMLVPDQRLDAIPRGER